jgi:hypothetical protein
MGAEIAFGRCIVVGIDIERVIRTGLHAAFASDTNFIVEVYDAIGTAEEGAGGADLNAGSVIAVVTSHDPEVAAAVGKFALLDVFHPRAKHTQRDLVLFLARHGTGVTADTSVLIDDEPVAHEKKARLFVAEEVLRFFTPRSMSDDRLF